MEDFVEGWHVKIDVARQKNNHLNGVFVQKKQEYMEF